MNGLASGQHLDERVNPSSPGFRFLGASDPVEDGVAIRTCKRLKHHARTRIGPQGSAKVFRHLNAGRPSVGGLPSPVQLCPSHFLFAGLMHAAGGDQPFSDGGIALGPRAARLSRGETSSKCG